MNKMATLTTGAALTAAVGMIAAKPLAVVGLGTLVMTIWTMTFKDAYASDVYSEDAPRDGIVSKDIAVI